MDRLKRLQQQQPNHLGPDVLLPLSVTPRSPRGTKAEWLELKELGHPADHADESPAKDPAPEQEDLSRQLMARLGPQDAPIVGEGRYLLVETKIGPATSESPRFVTEEVNVTEEELVRMVQQRAEAGLLFVSNTFGLATFEITEAQRQHVMLHPLPNDAGVDFEAVLEKAREQALNGWRLRGCLRGRGQIQDFVLGYAMYADVVVTPFSHLFFTLDAAAPRMQIEMVELRGTGNIISGALVRIVRAWARRGWRLSCLVYNLVTTYDKVTLDPPEQRAGPGGPGGETGDMTDTFPVGEEVGGGGELGLYYHVGAFFDRRHVPQEEGQIQAKLALQRRHESDAAARPSPANPLAMGIV